MSGSFKAWRPNAERVSISFSHYPRVWDTQKECPKLEESSKNIHVTLRPLHVEAKMHNIAISHLVVLAFYPH
jgi:hypothetical protein